jgi:hypothetical protein
MVLVLAGACGVVVSRADVPGPEVAADGQLRQRIRDMTDGLRDVPLPVIIDALTGHRVVPWKGESRERLLAVAKRIEDLIAAGEIEASRVNEAGNKVENVVIEAMKSLGIQAARPRSESGRARSTGYPDLEAEIDGTGFYIEVKTFSAATIDSSQRSFYLSPSTDFKVTRDAIHLLVAVELLPTSRGSYRAQSVRWLDLSGLRCDLKYEFSASNRDLYRRESGLVVVELPVETVPPAEPALAPAAEKPASPKP